MVSYTHKVKNDPTACLVVECDRTDSHSDYWHVTLYARRREVDQYGQPDLRWPDNGYPYNLPYLAALRVTCQGNNRQPDRDAYPLYAYRIAYENAGTIEAEEAKAMYLTLARVDTRMAAMAREEGSIKTFGMFAMRAARALGITAIVRANRNELAMNKYVAMNPAEAADWIDRQIESWRADMREKYGVAA